MQRIDLLVLFALLLAGFAASAALAEETSLEEVTLGAKVGTIGFFSGAAEDLDVDSAPYLGLEAFWRLSDRLHLDNWRLSAQAGYRF